MNSFDSWNEIKKKIDVEKDKPNRFPQNRKNSISISIISIQTTKKFLQF